MCFHSKQSKKAQQIENKFNAKFETNNDFAPTNHYNGFNFPKTPLITNDDSTTIQMLNWGLVPQWANQNWNKSYTLNARIETIEDKPAFKDVIENRCIILVDGFYEWQHVGKQKIKYEIGFENELFAFAGLYSEFENIKTYTIITTEAKGIMREIHNTKLRMPIALKEDIEIENWLVKKEVKPRFDFTAIALDQIQPTLF
ncbi:SOS response-associated peptidase [Winogradskyella helgolandensis]|uniref:SOS response-associated peptidase n=1 Tax=Winogradskyella helgolandensis TaxID=2697010 RepID=UPI0015CDA564|nr:SOS response-associated peptidase [Winogradskyella helgolandensis]